MSFLLKATHIPTGEVQEYIWAPHPEPAMSAAQGMFYQGFACGYYAHAFPGGAPEDLAFDVTEVPDVPAEPSESPVEVGTPLGVTTFASGRVEHPETPSGE